MAANRLKKADWESVYPLYKTGLSNCQIVKQYAEDHKHSQTYKNTITEGAIRVHAKRKKWQKNLAEKVQAQVKENLIRNDIRDEVRSSDMTNEQIIAEAATTGANVVLLHRKEIAAFRKHEERLLDLLEKDAAFQEVKEGDVAPREVSTKEQSITLKNIADVVTKRIALERQAYNIDGSEATERFEDFLRGI